VRFVSSLFLVADDLSPSTRFLPDTNMLSLPLQLAAVVLFSFCSMASMSPYSLSCIFILSLFVTYFGVVSFLLIPASSSPLFPRFLSPFPLQRKGFTSPRLFDLP